MCIYIYTYTYTHIYIYIYIYIKVIFNVYKNFVNSVKRDVKKIKKKRSKLFVIKKIYSFSTLLLIFVDSSFV